jgi:hypothetical protein
LVYAAQLSKRCIYRIGGNTINEIVFALDTFAFDFPIIVKCTMLIDERLPLRLLRAVLRAPPQGSLYGFTECDAAVYLSAGSPNAINAFLTK